VLEKFTRRRFAAGYPPKADEGARGSCTLLQSDGYRCEAVRRALQYHGGGKMSRHNLRTLSVVKLVVPVAALAAMLAMISCVDLDGDDDVDERFYGYFLRDEKAMEDMGLPVYWLGRQFTATPGGLAFRGPYGDEFGGEVEGGGIYMEYVTEGANRLDMTVYSLDAWALVKERIINPPSPSVPSRYSVTRRTVDVMGRKAQLISAPSGRRPVNRLTLVLDLDAVVVASEAHSVLSADGDSELNIFINNPDLLVQVIDENLRPYPE